MTKLVPASIFFFKNWAVVQTANLAAEAGHDLWTHPAGADAEPITELEFDKTLGLLNCAA